MPKAKASPPSIHKSGAPAAKSLIRVLKKAGMAEAGVASGRKARHDPDVKFTPRGRTEVIGIEVKKAGKSVPQMRPLSYKTHVILRKTDGKPIEWWVIPPADLLEMALEYSGQHCVSAFECMNPGKPADDWNRWKCDKAKVAARILAAFEAGNRSPLKTVAARIDQDIRLCHEMHKSWVKGAIAKKAKPAS